MAVNVSVIMPSLNVADYIDECMHSVLDQTLKNIEIICIDAGSTDGTWEKLTKYASIDGRVVLVHSDVKSYGAQVNKGIDMARGEYIAILETDDYIEPGMYETLYDMVKGTSVDYIKADFDTFKTEKNGKRKFELVKLGGNEDGMIYNRVIDPRRVCNLYVYDYYIWKGIYRRSFLIDNGIRLNESKGAAYQDIGFSHQIHTYATKAYYSDMSFYRYRLDRDESSSNSLYGLSYGHQEYKWLLENREFQSRIVCPKGIYMHMASSFRGEMNKTLPAVGFDTESEYIKPHYDWIKARLINDAGRYLDGYRALIADLGEMLDDLEGYCGRIKGEYLKKKAMEDMIHSTDKGGGVVIFGAGKRGRRMLGFLLDKGVNNVTFADNDSSLWGSYVDGVKVFDPAKCVEMYVDGCFIIANSANSEEIVEQLVSMGVDRGHILDCYGEIFGLKLE